VKYFTIGELVQPEIITALGAERCVDKIGWFVATGLDFIREDYEKEVKARGLFKSKSDAWIIINGRFGGMNFKYSGVRAPDCPIGAKFSKHKEWRAFDLKCNHLDVLVEIIKERHQFYGINRIENPEITKTWLHVEFGHVEHYLYIFNP
jgi:hypothetical protein